MNAQSGRHPYDSLTRPSLWLRKEGQARAEAAVEAVGERSSHPATPTTDPRRTRSASSRTGRERDRAALHAPPHVLALGRRFLSGLPHQRQTPRSDVGGAGTAAGGHAAGASRIGARDASLCARSASSAMPGLRWSAGTDQPSAAGPPQWPTINDACFWTDAPGQRTAPRRPQGRQTASGLAPCDWPSPVALS